MKTFKRPNILILYTDQQRWDSLGCNGNSQAKTPYLDGLAARGARFSNYFVQNPVCMPSRMAFLTGRYCSSLGIGFNGIPLPQDTLTLNRMLKPYGYHTAQIGKLHFQPHAARNHRNPHPDYGFDTMILSDEPGCYDDAYVKWVEANDPDNVENVRCSLPPEAYRFRQKAYSGKPRDTHEPYAFGADEFLTHSSFVAEETCNYIRKHKDGPFLAIAGFYAPHAPVNPPQRFVDMFDPKDMPEPVIGEEDEILPHLKGITKEGWRKIAAYYHALVSHVDDCTGRIMKVLEDEGIFDDTIVLFTSDHGEYLGDHGKVGKWMPGHDCIIKVPFIISYPGLIQPGSVIGSMAEAVDVVPTILDCCGIQQPAFIQGKSMKRLLAGETTGHRDDILVEMFIPSGEKSATVRTEAFKYFHSSTGQEILYDLKKDPNELHNRVNDAKYKDIVSAMRKRMLDRTFDSAFNSHEPTALY